jgi:hypothetical protein
LDQLHADLEQQLVAALVFQKAQELLEAAARDVEEHGDAEDKIGGGDGRAAAEEGAVRDVGR